MDTMNTYELEKRLKGLILKRLKVAYGRRLKVSPEELDEQIKETQEEIERSKHAEAVHNLAVRGREASLFNASVRAAAKSNKAFVKDYNKFYNVLKVVPNFDIDNNLCHIIVKTNGDNVVEYSFGMSWWDSRSFSAKFLLSDSYDEFAESIDVIKKTKTDHVGSNGGHPQTKDVKYPPEDILEDIIYGIKLLFKND